MPSAILSARTRAPLVMPQPTARADPAALAQWLDALPPAALQQYQQRVWQLAVARAGQGGIADFDASMLIVPFTQAAASVGTALFSNEQNRSLEEQTTASTNASNSALSTAQASAASAVAQALAAAKKQALTPGAPGAPPRTTSKTATTSGSTNWLLWGSAAVIGIIVIKLTFTGK